MIAFTRYFGYRRWKVRVPIFTSMTTADPEYDRIVPVAFAPVVSSTVSIAHVAAGIERMNATMQTVLRSVEIMAALPTG
jgi:hypothetical protein